MKLQWAALGGVFLLALGGAAAFLALREPPAPRAYAAPGIETATAQEATDQAFAMVPALLAVVYQAFAAVDEAEIYDTLAQVSAGDALEALYLERAGAMVGGGLEAADQTIHEMEIVALSAHRTGETIALDATWRVIGTVGHAEHLHVRGNTYAAELTVEPVEEAWRLTQFTLTDVDRSDAGTYVPAERDWFAGSDATGVSVPAPSPEAEPAGQVP